MFYRFCYSFIFSLSLLSAFVLLGWPSSWAATALTSSSTTSTTPVVRLMLPPAWQGLKKAAMPPAQNNPAVTPAATALELNQVLGFIERGDVFPASSKQPFPVEGGAASGSTSSWVSSASPSSLWPGVENTLENLLNQAMALPFPLASKQAPKAQLLPLLHKQAVLGQKTLAVQRYSQWVEAYIRWQQAAVKLNTLELEWQDKHYAFTQGEKPQTVLLSWQQGWLAQLSTLQQLQTVHHLARLALQQVLPATSTWQNVELTLPTFWPTVWLQPQPEETPEELLLIQEEAPLVLMEQLQQNRPEWQLLRWLESYALKNGAKASSKPHFGWPFHKASPIQQALSPTSLNTLHQVLEQSSQIALQQLAIRQRQQRQAQQLAFQQWQQAHYTQQRVQLCIQQGLCRALDGDLTQQAEQLASWELRLAKARTLQLTTEQMLLVEP